MSEVIANLGHLTPESIWSDKDKWAPAEATSEKLWEKMDPDMKETIFAVVSRHLERCLDRLDEWLPYALRVEKGDYIDVVFRMVFADLEAEMKVQNELTKRQITAAIADTKRMIQELGHEVDD